MSDLKLFNPADIDSQAFLMASHMPTGKAWEKSFDPFSNMGKLVRGLGVEIYRLEVLTGRIADEIDINQTSDLLVEWERSVGLPDSCFSTDVPIEERRKQVLQKFSNFGGVQKAEDFVRVAAVFGFNVLVSPGVVFGSFPLSFPLTFFDDTKSVTHAIIVEVLGDITGDFFFPLSFPINFSFGGKSFLQCIFDKLAPANVKVLIKNEGDI